MPIKILFFFTSLGAFAKLRKATISFVMCVCPSAWHISVPSGEFSWNLVFEYFSKVFGEDLSLIKNLTRTTIAYMKTNIHLRSYLVHFLEWEMFLTKVVEILRTHFTFNTPSKIVLLCETINMWYSQTDHRWQYNTALTLYMLDKFGASRHTLRICSTSWFSTETVVVWKQLNVKVCT
jgi:hypothetical protein